MWIFSNLGYCPPESKENWCCQESWLLQGDKWGDHSLLHISSCIYMYVWTGTIQTFYLLIRDVKILQHRLRRNTVSKIITDWFELVEYYNFKFYWGKAITTEAVYCSTNNTAKRQFWSHLNIRSYRRNDIDRSFSYANYIVYYIIQKGQQKTSVWADLSSQILHVIIPYQPEF